MKQHLVVLGAGGHAKVVLDLLLENGDFDVVGCTASGDAPARLLGIPVLGGDEVLPDLLSRGVRQAFVAIGDNRIRLQVIDQIKARGFTPINAVSRHAIVSSRVRLGGGIAIMPGAVVNVDAMIGDGAIVNTGATVDHDCSLGRGVHVGPGSHLAGRVTLAEGVFLGAGCIVIPGIRIGEWTTVGAGSVVIRDLPARITAAGVPARILNRVGE